MKRFLFAIVVVFVSVFLTSNVFARTVILKSVSSGEYEDGKYSERRDSFEGEYSINDQLRTVELKKIITNDRQGKLNEGARYDITHTALSEGLSSFFFSKNKKGQKIITAVRDVELDVLEILIIGEDFYEYCQTANGKFYLEYGKVYTQ